MGKNQKSRGCCFNAGWNRHCVFSVGVNSTIVSPIEMAHCRPGKVSICPCERHTAPFAFVATITNLTSMPFGSCLPTRVQLLPAPRLNCFGICGASSTAPKSVMFGGAAAWYGCSLERFEQLLEKRTINKTAPMVMKCCARIKWVVCFTARPFSFFDFA